MDYLEAVILGIVEGLTEFLPVSSTGHLTIAAKLLGLELDDPAVTAYTAVIQMGAIAGRHRVLRKGIARIATAWCRGLVERRVARASRPADGLVRHRRQHPGRRRRSAGQGPHHRRRCAPVGGRRRADRWSGVMRSRSGLPHRSAAEARADPARRLVVGLRPGPRPDPRRVALGRDDLRRAVPRPRPAWPRPGCPSSCRSRRCWRRALRAARTPSTGRRRRPDVVGTVVASWWRTRVAWLLRFVADHSIAPFVPYRVVLGALAAGAARHRRDVGDLVLATDTGGLTRV